MGRIKDKMNSVGEEEWPINEETKAWGVWNQVMKEISRNG